ncbi:hypothetical protein CSKR_113892 [Clonorchis sinensis]|uniref:Uncharacterized protein n=1 Tax=Clonorchis sinensis TaxID=79923 RepID=A0A419Q7Y7_CLOSI|nr:hypothetical protein CSKR_113892 [Clonorchis sinensis]
MADWLESEFTDLKVCVLNMTFASRLFLSWLGQPGSTPAPVISEGGMAARHRKGVTAEWCLLYVVGGFLVVLLELGHLRIQWRESARLCGASNHVDFKRLTITKSDLLPRLRGGQSKIWQQSVKTLTSNFSWVDICRLPDPPDSTR